MKNLFVLHKTMGLKEIKTETRRVNGKLEFRAVVLGEGPITFEGTLPVVSITESGEPSDLFLKEDTDFGIKLIPSDFKTDTHKLIYSTWLVNWSIPKPIE